MKNQAEQWLGDIIVVHHDNLQVGSSDLWQKRRCWKMQWRSKCWRGIWVSLLGFCQCLLPFFQSTTLWTPSHAENKKKKKNKKNKKKNRTLSAMFQCASVSEQFFRTTRQNRCGKVIYITPLWLSNDPCHSPGMSQPSESGMWVKGGDKQTNTHTGRTLSIIR